MINAVIDSILRFIHTQGDKHNKNPNKRKKLRVHFADMILLVKTTVL